MSVPTIWKRGHHLTGSWPICDKACPALQRGACHVGGKNNSKKNFIFPPPQGRPVHMALACRYHTVIMGPLTGFHGYWKERAGMRLLPAAILAIGTLCATSYAHAADPDWIFANSGPAGQPMVMSHQYAGYHVLPCNQRCRGHCHPPAPRSLPQPQGVETAMVMIGKFTIALQIFSTNQKWDTAGGDLNPDTVPDLVNALKAAATGALIPSNMNRTVFGQGSAGST